jgi:hypothetical protein
MRFALNRFLAAAKSVMQTETTKRMLALRCPRDFSLRAGKPTFVNLFVPTDRRGEVGLFSVQPDLTLWRL